MRLLHLVQNVQRIARIPDEQEYRSTAEHTFELVVLAWYIIDTDKLPLSHEKVLKYALAHDLIEGYAGDTYFGNEELAKNKKEREAAALARIKSEFAEFADLITYMEAYETRADEESKFVYALDKLIDPLNSSMDTTRSIWTDLNMSYALLREYKDHKIAQSEHIVPYWEQLIAKIDAKKDFFFSHDTPKTELK